MKRFASIIPLFTIIITIIFSGTTCFTIDLNAKTGFNYDWWESDDNDQGSQFYVPLKIKGEYKDDYRDKFWIFYLPTGKVDIKVEYKNGKAKNQEELDKREKKEFEKYEKDAKKLKEPEEYFKNRY